MDTNAATKAVQDEAQSTQNKQPESPKVENACTRRKTSHVLLVALLFCIITFSYWKYHLSSSRNVADTEAPFSSPGLGKDDFGIIAHGIHCGSYPEETHRFDPTSGSVACWPSTGGIWVSRSLHPVELQYLGIDRFNVVQRSLDHMEEDQFCQALRKFGASWWDLSPDRITCASEIGWEPVIHPLVQIKRETCVKDGGGYLVLDTSTDQFEGLERLRGGLPERFWGELRQSLNMQERCDVLAQWGAVFCKDEGCPAFEDLKEQSEGIRVP